MSITSEITRIQNAKGALKTVLQKEGYQITDSMTIDEYAPAITDVVEKDVNFYDYDGKRVYSYTTSQFLAISAMPANPSHDGLTAQGWNWSLSDAKAYVTANEVLDVGQNYVTSDGKTRIYITVPDTRLDFSLNIEGNANSQTATIAWGDGSTTAVNHNEAYLYTHTYSFAGDYVVTITVISGTHSILGPNPSDSTDLGSASTGMMQKVELGTGVVLGLHAFVGSNIRSINIPTSISSLPSRCFNGNQMLKCVVIPPAVTTSVGSSNVFSYSGLEHLIQPNELQSVAFMAQLYNQRSMIIPSGLTSTPTVVGYSANLMRKLVFPAGVTSISSSSFFSGNVVIMKSTTPPTLGGNNQFSGAKIYVPYSSDHSVLAAYKAADKWSLLADRIFESSQ